MVSISRRTLSSGGSPKIASCGSLLLASCFVVHRNLIYKYLVRLVANP